MAINPTQITPPRVAFIDPRSGTISREWYRFFLSLWTAQTDDQDAVGSAPDTASALASYDAALSALANATAQSPDAESLLSAYSATIQAISTNLAGLPDALSQAQSDIMELAKDVQALELAPRPTPQIPQYVYGCFYSTANQPDGSTTTAYPLLYDSTAYSKNVTLVDRTASFTASIGPASTTMTVTAIGSGPIYPGMIITGTGVTAGTRIVSQSSGADGSTGTYIVDTAQTVGSTTITGACTSKLKAEIAGVYNVQFSVQMVNTDANIHDIDIWLRKNGSDVTATNSQFSVPSKHAGVDGHNIGALNLFIDLAADEYVELMWATNDATTTIQYIGAQTGPVRPSTPSVIVTMNLVSVPTLQGV